MNCPRCTSLMTARTVVAPSDARQLLTTHLCTQCMKRIAEFTPNPRYVPPPDKRSDQPHRPARFKWRLEDVRGLE